MRLEPKKNPAARTSTAPVTHTPRFVFIIFSCLRMNKTKPPACVKLKHHTYVMLFLPASNCAAEFRSSTCSFFEERKRQSFLCGILKEDWIVSHNHSQDRAR